MHPSEIAVSLQFTPAARRALEAASHWTSCDNPNGIAPAELLMGLLAEAECRAAVMLAARGVDAPLVRQRWPDLQFSGQVLGRRADEFSDGVSQAFAAAAARLIDYPPPLVLATEHLLLGLVASPSEISQWLGEYGLVANALEAEIHRLAGHQPGPLAMDAVEISAEQTEPHILPLSAAELSGEGDAMSFAAANARVQSAPEPGRPIASPLPTLEGTRNERTALFRILDAAANRAREGLRVLEDFVRFALDSEALTFECKQLRHALAAELARIDLAELLAARNTTADVGTQLTADSERRRVRLEGVATANIKRVQESLRSLEEFGKVVDADFGAAMKQLRYRTYTLERAVSDGPSSLKQIEQARLYVLIDGRASNDEFVALAQALVTAGVDVVQLRDKRLNDRQLLGRARQLREITRAAGVLFIMNDRADLAVVAGADGVHVGQEELSVQEARAIVGTRSIVGVSTHSLAQAKQAAEDGADYIGVGPTFASTTKRFESTQLTGLDLLSAVAAEIRVPAFAIGGVDATNLADVVAAGFSRIAVSGAIVAAADPSAAARNLRTTLERASLPVTHPRRAT